MMRALVFAILLLGAACGGGGGAPPQAQAPLVVPPNASGFVNWENLSVHPVDITPDRHTLLVCNTADHRLELFDVFLDVPVPLGSVFVGLDPVSVRARSNVEAWVVNHISDSISVVDLPTRRVVATLQTLDEPADVIFAGSPPRAFVTCSQANAVLVFEPDDLSRAPVEVAIDAEDPRALAASADGREVYVAIFESGNGTTLLGGGIDTTSGSGALAFPPNVVGDPQGPHGGVNPPPNRAGLFDPPQKPGNPPPPPVGLIVRKDDAARWRDDTGADWTDFVSGARAARSGRPPGWDLPDRDVAVIDTATLGVRYLSRGMNLCMALAVQPGSGRVTVVGTDATNEVRFDPNARGVFVRAVAASFDAASGARTVQDLNPHLDYVDRTVPQAARDEAIGDPRGIVWNGDGSRAYVTGMGSNNVLVLDPDLARVARVEVGEGPTGLVVDPEGLRVYVLNRFEGSVSYISTVTNREVARVPFFDPTPVAIKRGRRHLYDTHGTSGLGHLSCASCHIDARMDRLAWDLGDPAGDVRPLNQNCITDPIVPCDDFHPMKGPMLTQTLQDIIGKEPLHWRGDRDGIEEFNFAFISLLGDDAVLSAAEMQEFKAFLATIRFPPNPNRNLDNTLPAAMALPGHFTTGRFGPPGRPLGVGNAQSGLDLYRTASLDAGVPGFQCVTCHTLPTGMGPDLLLQGGVLSPVPPGPNGERHHSLVSVDGSTNVSMKIPQLRNLYERTGLEFAATSNRAGFGFIHDGSVDSLARFVTEPVFQVASDQQVADLVAFMLCFSGSDLPEGSLTLIGEPPGPPSADTHAAVGKQVTFTPLGDDGRLAQLLALAAAGEIDLIAKGPGRGWFFDSTVASFRADGPGGTISSAALRSTAAAGNEITFTAVPKGAGRRLGIDRDDDGVAD